MYVCIYVCMYVCMYVCTYACSSNTVDVEIFLIVAYILYVAKFIITVTLQYFLFISLLTTYFYL